jgi:hypothetical protein
MMREKAESEDGEAWCPDDGVWLYFRRRSARIVVLTLVKSTQSYDPCGSLVPPAMT